MTDRIIQVQMDDAEDDSPVELVLGNPVSRVYSADAQNNQVTFTIPDTVLKTSLGEVQISITVSSGGYTATKSYVIEPVGTESLFDDLTSAESMMITLLGESVDVIKVGAEHVISMDWINENGEYVGQRDAQYIAPAVSTGSIQFVSNSGVTNFYTYTPPETTNIANDVTITWGRYDDQTLTSSNIAAKTFSLLSGDFGITTPANGSQFSGPDMYFAWTGPVGSVYDLHLYTDAARTIKAVDKSGSVLDTNSIGTATSHTFYGTIENGQTLYARLYRWDDSTYSGGPEIEDITVISSNAGVSTLTMDVEWTEGAAPFTVQLSPASGVLAGTTQTFTIAGLPGTYTWGLNAGTETNNQAYDNSGPIIATGEHSITMENLPVDGSDVVIKLYLKTQDGEITTTLHPFVAHTSSTSSGTGNLTLHGSAIGSFLLVQRNLDPNGAANTGGQRSDKNAIGFIAKENVLNSIRPFIVYTSTPAGYHSGDGGLINITIQSDSGGNPSGTVLAQTGDIIAATDIWSGSTTAAKKSAAQAKYPGAIWTQHNETGTQLKYYRRFDLTSPLTTTVGQKYWIVFENTSPDKSNTVSIDHMYADKQLIRQSDPNFDESHEWKVKSLVNGVWNDDSASTNYGLFGIFEAIGTRAVGNSYYQVRSGNQAQIINSSTSYRERFVPYKTMTVDELGIGAAHISGTNSLAVTVVQNGVTLLSTTLSGFETSSSSSNIAILHRATSWKSKTFSSKTLTANVPVYVTVTANGGTHHIGCGADGAKAGYFIGDETLGNGLKGSRAEINTGSGWSSISPNDISFYFREA